MAHEQGMEQGVLIRYTEATGTVRPPYFRTFTTRTRTNAADARARSARARPSSRLLARSPAHSFARSRTRARALDARAHAAECRIRLWLAVATSTEPCESTQAENVSKRDFYGVPSTAQARVITSSVRRAAIIGACHRCVRPPVTAPATRRDRFWPPAGASGPPARKWKSFLPTSFFATWKSLTSRLCKS